MKIADILVERGCALVEADPLVTGKIEFRDRIGILLGTFETEDKTITARDRNGRTVGVYDVDANVTRNYNGQRVGTGNLLSSLFLTFAKPLF
jgi:hypothetical protein